MLGLSKQQYLAEFTSDLLEINLINDKMESRVKESILHINGTLDDQRFFREYHIFERTFNYQLRQMLSTNYLQFSMFPDQYFNNIRQLIHLNSTYFNESISAINLFYDGTSRPYIFQDSWCKTDSYLNPFDDHGS
ncbi:hypothetical protein BD560DRAFT_441936 [Blakeslea trispora]|nr:hypothetical protein BD560DRAFT_441936 [Blakeslea trispora]